MNDQPELRVTLITHYFPAHQGGVESVAFQLARRMCERRVEITWFASDVDSPPQHLPGLKIVPVRASNFIERRMHLPYPIWSVLDLPSIWRAIRHADVVHLHDFIYMGSLAAFSFAKLLRKPVVITQHIGSIPYKLRLMTKALQLINRLVGARMLRYADRAIFISSSVQQYFASLTRFTRIPQFIPNGVDSDTFVFRDRERRSSIRYTLNFSDDQLVLLFVGRFVEKKGLHFLKELARRNTNCRWVFAGAGPLDPQLWDLPNVCVYRGLQGSSLAELYCAADVLILPSKGEGFPLVVQEAMSCGTPALIDVAIVAAFPAIAAHVFAEAMDDVGALEKWNDAIQKFSSDRMRLADMRAAVASFAREHWSWEKCVEEYLRVFRQIRLDANRVQSKL